jgi:hypothetical protein
MLPSALPRSATSTRQRAGIARTRTILAYRSFSSSEVRATFELIAESPGAFAEIHRDVRRCPVRAFPAYSVFYRITADVVVIYGCVPRAAAAARSGSGVAERPVSMQVVGLKRTMKETVLR